MKLECSVITLPATVHGDPRLEAVEAAYTILMERLTDAPRWQNYTLKRSGFAERPNRLLKESQRLPNSHLHVCYKGWGRYTEFGQTSAARWFVPGLRVVFTELTGDCRFQN